MKATALGVGGTVVGDSVTVTYSGQALITGGLPANYVLKNGIDTTFTYTVSDVNGNPLAEGSQIQVSAAGTGAPLVVLSGDVNVSMPDTRTVSAATFSVRVRDTNTVVTATTSITVSIAVAGPNGASSQQIVTTLKGVPVSATTYPRIAGLAFVASSQPQVSVKNTGGVESSVLTYELRDSVDNPIQEPGIKVAFLKSGVLGHFSKDTVLTDESGLVKTIFSSDTVAGIAQVQANVAGSAVSSTTSRVVIVGGKPALKYFTFILAQPTSHTSNVNFPGALPQALKIGEARVQMGDRYGNPVPVGTPVYFTTNAGVISGVAYADIKGTAQVDWYSGNPIPANELASVSASALADTGTFSVVNTVAYTGATVLTGGPAANYTIAGGGSSVYSYRVSDLFGMPVAEGSTVMVSASGPASPTIILSGDVNVAVADSKDTMSSFLSFTARDTSNTSTSSRALTLTIAVVGPNGSVTRSFAGTVLAIGTAQSSRTRYPASIALISLTTPDIQVVGTGGTETSTLVMQVNDSVGVAVDSAYQVSFTLSNAPAGSYISPPIGFNDASNGRIAAVMHAGTVSGVIQIVATVIGPTGSTITSSPVLMTIHSGLPDQTHFTIYPSQVNFAGLDLANKIDSIHIIAGDKYANPVSDRTAIYFTTHAGVITPSGLTDGYGQTGAILFSGNPYPDALNPDPNFGLGFAEVYGRTTGINGVTVLDSTMVLFSGAPIINSTALVNPSFVTSYGSTVDFNNITIADRFGNPIVGGSVISVSFVSSAPITASAPIVTIDTQSTGAGTTIFNFSMSTVPTANGVPASVKVYVNVKWAGNGETTTQLIATGTIQ